MLQIIFHISIENHLSEIQFQEPIAFSTELSSCIYIQTDVSIEAIVSMISATSPSSALSLIFHDLFLTSVAAWEWIPESVLVAEMILGVCDGRTAISGRSSSAGWSWKNDSRLLLLDSSRGWSGMWWRGWTVGGRIFTESPSTPLFLVDSKSLRRFSLLFNRSGWPNLKDISKWCLSNDWSYLFLATGDCFSCVTCLFVFLLNMMIILTTRTMTMIKRITMAM